MGNESSVTINLEELTWAAPFILVTDGDLIVTWASAALLKRAKMAVGRLATELIECRRVTRVADGSEGAESLLSSESFYLLSDNLRLPLVGRWLTVPNGFILMAMPDVKNHGELSGFTLEDIPAHSFLIEFLGAQDEILHSQVEALQAAEALRRKNKMIEEAYAALETEIAVRKEAERALQELTEELRRSNQELEQFAYIASHDLQEPLRMVSNYLQLLARRYQGKLDKDADEFIGFAVDGAQRMQRLINDLLTYSRVGTRGRPPEPTESSKVLERVLLNLRIAIEENGAEVTFEPLPRVMADERQLEQLFQNLLGNAIKFHRKGERPKVHVRAEQRDGTWLFAVRDNGIGIEPQYQEKVFQIFQRLHTREEYPGTGIGLAVCRKIVERHGGEIWFESEPGKGTTFFFTLPAAKS